MPFSISKLLRRRSSTKDFFSSSSKDSFKDQLGDPLLSTHTPPSTSNPSSKSGSATNLIDSTPRSSVDQNAQGSQTPRLSSRLRKISHHRKHSKSFQSPVISSPMQILDSPFGPTSNYPHLVDIHRQYDLEYDGDGLDKPVRLPLDTDLSAKGGHSEEDRCQPPVPTSSVAPKMNSRSFQRIGSGTTAFGSLGRSEATGLGTGDLSRRRSETWRGNSLTASPYQRSGSDFSQDTRSGSGQSGGTFASPEQEFNQELRQSITKREFPPSSRQILTPRDFSSLSIENKPNEKRPALRESHSEPNPKALHRCSSADSYQAFGLGGVNQVQAGSFDRIVNKNRRLQPQTTFGNFSLESTSQSSTNSSYSLQRSSLSRTTQRLQEQSSGSLVSPKSSSSTLDNQFSWENPQSLSPSPRRDRRRLKKQSSKEKIWRRKPPELDLRKSNSREEIFEKETDPLTGNVTFTRVGNQLGLDLHGDGRKGPFSSTLASYDRLHSRNKSITRRPSAPAEIGKLSNAKKDGNRYQVGGAFGGSSLDSEEKMKKTYQHEGLFFELVPGPSSPVIPVKSEPHNRQTSEEMENLQTENSVQDSESDGDQEYLLHHQKFNHSPHNTSKPLKPPVFNRRRSFAVSLPGPHSPPSSSSNQSSPSSTSTELKPPDSEFSSPSKLRASWNDTPTSSPNQSLRTAIFTRNNNSSESLSLANSSPRKGLKPLLLVAKTSSSNLKEQIQAPSSSSTSSPASPYSQPKDRRKGVIIPDETKVLDKIREGGHNRVLLRSESEAFVMQDIKKGYESSGGRGRKFSLSSTERGKGENVNGIKFNTSIFSSSSQDYPLTSYPSQDYPLTSYPSQDYPLTSYLKSLPIANQESPGSHQAQAKSKEAPPTPSVLKARESGSPSANSITSFLSETSSTHSFENHDREVSTVVMARKVVGSGQTATLRRPNTAESVNSSSRPTSNLQRASSYQQMYFNDVSTSNFSRAEISPKNTTSLELKKQSRNPVDIDNEDEGSDEYHSPQEGLHLSLTPRNSQISTRYGIFGSKWSDDSSKIHDDDHSDW